MWCPRQTVMDGVGEGLLLFSASWAESRGSRAVRQAGVGSKVTFLRPHLVDATSYELLEVHEGVRGQSKGEGVVIQDWGEAFPVFN